MKRLIVCWIAAVIWSGIGISGSVEAAETTKSFFPRVDVLIDAGHGGIDGGTSQGNVLEKDLNLAVSLKLYELLQEKGIRVALNRNKDYAPSDDNTWLRIKSRHLRDLAQRKLLIDELEPKLTVSIHTNWARNVSERGPSALYQPNQMSYLAATLIVDKLNGLYGTSGGIYPGKTFYLLKRAESPTVIVEIGFISNKQDRTMLTSRSGQKKIAEALASAIEQYVLFHDLSQ